jgi:activator of 2-hydroxyglutaryl-CoA dehydratase
VAYVGSVLNAGGNVNFGKEKDNLSAVAGHDKNNVLARNIAANVCVTICSGCSAGCGRFLPTLSLIEIN